MKNPYEYIFTGPNKLFERLEKLFEQTDNHHHLITGVSALFALWGQDLVSVVHIIEGFFFKKTCDNFVGT